MNAQSSLASSLICVPRAARRSLLAGSHPGANAADATGFHAGMHAAHPACRDHALAMGRLLALPDQCVRVLCLEGELWLTRDGDIEDYILGPGQSFIARRGDQVMVQALRPSRVRVAAG